ncbi:MAG: hypothetical protein BWY95_02065 [Bacteroidetes bacterium ADurb.BinA104]|nr:MAG: hypothetical protein BWY95_02065 [Bacteroidetes bacterium ADurb.BinA104]
MWIDNLNINRTSVLAVWCVDIDPDQVLFFPLISVWVIFVLHPDVVVVGAEAPEDVETRFCIGEVWCYWFKCFENCFFAVVG